MAGLENGLRRLCLANRLLEVNLGDIRLGLVSPVKSHHFGDNFSSLNHSSAETFGSFAGNSGYNSSLNAPVLLGTLKEIYSKLLELLRLTALRIF